MAPPSEKRPRLEQARRLWRVARVIQGEKSMPRPARRRPPAPPAGRPPRTD